MDCTHSLHFVPQIQRNLRQNIAWSCGRPGDTRSREGAQAQNYHLPGVSPTCTEFPLGGQPKVQLVYRLCQLSLTAHTSIALEIVSESTHIGSSCKDSPQLWILLRGSTYQERSSHPSARLQFHSMISSSILTIVGSPDRLISLVGEACVDLQQVKLHYPWLSLRDLAGPWLLHGQWVELLCLNVNMSPMTNKNSPPLQATMEFKGTLYTALI